MGLDSSNHAKIMKNLSLPKNSKDSRKNLEKSPIPKKKMFSILYDSVE
jgi:hypothetical protein